MLGTLKGVAVKTHCPHAVKQGIGAQTGIRADGNPALVTPKGRETFRLLMLAA